MAQGISPQDLAGTPFCPLLGFSPLRLMDRHLRSRTPHSTGSTNGKPDLLSYLPSLTIPTPSSNSQLFPHLALGIASPTPLINHLEATTATLIPFIRRGPEGETESGKQWNWKVLMGWWVWENEFGLGFMGRRVSEKGKQTMMEAPTTGRDEGREELEWLRGLDRKVEALERQVQGAREWLAHTTSASTQEGGQTASARIQNSASAAPPVSLSSPPQQSTAERKANASNTPSLSETEGGNDAAFTDDLGNPRDVWPIPEESDEEEERSGRGSPARYFNVDVDRDQDDTSEEEEEVRHGGRTPREWREPSPTPSATRAEAERKRREEREQEQSREQEEGDPESSLGARYVTLRRGNSHDGQQGGFRIGSPSYLNGQHGSSSSTIQQNQEQQRETEREKQKEDEHLAEERHDSDPINADELYDRLDAYASRTPESTSAFMANRAYETSPSGSPAQQASTQESSAGTTRPVPQQNRSNRNSVQYTREDLDDSYGDEEDEEDEEDYHDEHSQDHYEDHHEDHHEEPHPSEQSSHGANTTAMKGSPGRNARCETVPDSDFDLRNFQSSLLVSNSVLFSPAASSTPARGETRRADTPSRAEAKRPETPSRLETKRAETPSRTEPKRTETKRAETPSRPESIRASTPARSESIRPEENSSPAGGVSVRIDEQAHQSWQPSSPPVFRRAQVQDELEESQQLPCSPMVRRPRLVRDESLWEDRCPDGSWDQEELSKYQSSPPAMQASVEDAKSSSSPERQTKQQPTPSPSSQYRSVQASSSPQRQSSSPVPLPQSEARSRSSTPQSKIPLPRGYTSHAAGTSSAINISSTPVDAHHLKIHTASPLVPREAWASDQPIPEIEIVHPSSDNEEDEEYDQHRQPRRQYFSSGDEFEEDVGDETDIWLNPAPVQQYVPAPAPVPSTPIQSRVPSVPASIAKFLPKKSSPLKDYVYKPSSSSETGSSSRMDNSSDLSRHHDEQRERSDREGRYDFDESHHEEYQHEEEHSDDGHHSYEGHDDHYEVDRRDGSRPAYDFSSSTTEKSKEVKLDPPLEALIERLDFSDDDHEARIQELQGRRGSSPVTISRELEEKLEVLDFTDDEEHRSLDSISPHGELQEEGQHSSSPHSEHENEERRNYSPSSGRSSQESQQRTLSRRLSSSPHVEREDDMEHISTFVDGDTAELERSLERSLGLVAASMGHSGEDRQGVEWHHDATKVSEGAEEEEEESDYDEVREQREAARSRCISRRSMRVEEHESEEESEEEHHDDHGEEEREREERAAYSFDEDEHEHEHEEHEEHEQHSEQHSVHSNEHVPTDEHDIILHSNNSNEPEHTKELDQHDEYTEDERESGNENRSGNNSGTNSGNNSGSIPNQTTGNDLFETAMEYESSNESEVNPNETALPPSGSSSPISRVQTINSSESESEADFSTPGGLRSPARANSTRIPPSTPPLPPTNNGIRKNLFPRLASSSPIPRQRNSSPSLPTLPNSSPSLSLHPQTPARPRTSSPPRLEHAGGEFRTPQKQRDDRTVGFPTPIPKLEYTPRHSSSSSLLFPGTASSQANEPRNDNEQDNTHNSAFDPNLSLDLSGPLSQSSPHRRDHSLNLEDATLAFEEDEELSEVDVEDLSFSSPGPGRGRGARETRIRRNRVLREMKYVEEFGREDTGELFGSGDTGRISTGGFTGRLSGSMMMGGSSSRR
ncbi:hypothetical protein BJ508DRAFT_323585 [Ascobolus immersus RN42]|uniref:Uncharacterized protein n=1 Tax=Ascobolus immersus RN42 TaxID=1160509 RepID=A0A3N4IDT0_ASCIM|nr:hypothetical protein BJ508DRAFT_323585 [Ascobolus immersus RN42]